MCHKMKVVAVNGSPRKNGNTYQALNAMCRILNRYEIETEILSIGNQEIKGCMACGGCRKTGMCVYADETYRGWAEKLIQADGIILGSPVYYSGINGTLKCFLDRFFYSCGKEMRLKVGCSVAIARRSGNMPTFQQLNNYFLISEMIVAPSYYWNALYGAAPGEVLEDNEGMAVVKNLAQNMAYLLKMQEATRDQIPLPQPYPREGTNFIRS